MAEFTCEVCGKEFLARAGQMAHFRSRAHKLAERGAAATRGPEETDQPPTSPGPDDVLPGFEAETRPGGGAEPTSEVVPEKSTPGRALLGRLTKKKGDALGPTKETRPKAAHRRVPTADFWADAAAGMATVADRVGHTPLARAITFTSPVAGEIVEDVSKGTVVDRIIQPIARNQKRYEDLFDLLSLWVAVGAATALPEREEQFQMMGRRSLKRLLPRIVKKVAAERRAEQEQIDAIVELMPELEGMGLDPQDPIGSLWWMMFPPPPDVVDREPNDASVA